MTSMPKMNLRSDSLKRSAKPLLRFPEEHELLKKVQAVVAETGMNAWELRKYARTMHVELYLESLEKFLKDGSRTTRKTVNALAKAFGILPETVLPTEDEPDNPGIWPTASIMASRKQSSRQHWLQMHHHQETILAQVIFRHLQKHFELVAQHIKENAPPLLALNWLSVASATEDLMEDLEPKLLRAAFVGALSQREKVALVQGVKSLEWLQEFAIDLPARVVSGIRVGIKELVKQPYWASIASWSKKAIGSIIETGVRDGRSNREIAKEIKTASNGNLTRTQAAVVARTEAGGALNLGAFEALQELAEHDPGATKVWSAVIDDRTRDNHVSINGQHRPMNELFSNGLRYPGDYLGSAAERVNCRCSLLGGDLGI